jgi:SAM-dependent methyltransferase
MGAGRSILLRLPGPLRSGLGRAGLRAYEWRLARRSDADDRAGDDGLPLPPSSLRVLVNASPYAGYFLETGANHAAGIRAALEGDGVELESVGSLLDFGCGCGRVLRHWKDLDGVEIHGSDFNPGLVAWSQDNLPFAEVRGNELSPPLPYDDDQFGLVYALSVFTHFSEELQQPWLEELRRILRPGGHLLLTVHGRLFADRLRPEEVERFERGEVVTHFEDIAGSNLCAAYHPPGWVQKHAGEGFHVVEAVEAGESGGWVKGPESAHQDMYLLRRVG